jgi:site-specific DNA recombinase
VCYGCRNKLPTDDLEGIFQEQLKGFFLSSTDLVDYLKQADSTIKEKEALLRSLERQQKKLKSNMDKLLRLYLEDKISSDGFAREHQPLEEQLNQLQTEIPQIQGEVDFLKIQYLSSDEIIAEAQNLYGHWPDLEFEQKRHIIENITDKIIVGKSDVTIELCYIPSSSELMAKGQRTLMGSSRLPTSARQETSETSPPD